MKRKYISALAVTALLASAGTVNAEVAEGRGSAALVTSAAPQSDKCSGTVTDEEGEPLIGATVKVEGTSQVAATDIDGKFSFS